MIESQIEAPPDPGPEEEEIVSVESQITDLHLLLASDDKLATAVAELGAARLMIARMQRRINALMDEKAEAIRVAKALQNQINRSRRKVSASKKEGGHGRPF